MPELSDTDRRVLQILRHSGELSVEEAISLLTSRKGMKFREAASSVYRLWKLGYLDLRPPKPITGFTSYAFSPESLWFWALTALILFTMVLVFYATSPPLVYARYVLGTIYVLYVPGATLIEALYPRGDELEPLERLALSIGLSLALVPLIGLVLNYTPWGIRLVPVTVSLALTSWLLGLVALYRKYRYFKLRTLG